MTDCPFADPARIFDDLARARNTPGLFWSGQMKRWVVSRRADMVAALHDPATFSSAPTVPVLPPALPALYAGRVPDRGTLIGHDNPTHDRLPAAVKRSSCRAASIATRAGSRCRPTRRSMVSTMRARPTSGTGSLHPCR